MSGNRLIIGSEDNDDRHITLDKAVSNNKVMLPVTLYDVNGSAASFGGSTTPSSIGHGQAKVTNPGSPVKLKNTSTSCKRVYITASSSNSGVICVGGSNVLAAAGSETGIMILPTGSATIDIDDVSKIYVDATVANDYVTFAYTL